MTRREQIFRKEQRQLQLAKLLFGYIQERNTTVPLQDVFKQFPGKIGFTQVAHLYAFLDRQGITQTKPGAGKNKVASILVDSTALKFVADKLDKSYHQLADHMADHMADRSGEAVGYISRTQFHDMQEGMPEFAPIGDPVFSLELYPRN